MSTHQQQEQQQQQQQQQQPGQQEERRRDALSYLKDLPIHTPVSKENSVDYTCFFTAYIRAMESMSHGANAIVNDPFAKPLAGKLGETVVLASKSKRLDVSINMMAIRTRSIDEALDQRDAEIQQVVLLAAGLDSRAYRLPSLRNTHVFEIDRFKGLRQYKEDVLKTQLHAPQIARQVSILEADVVHHAWDQLLMDAGFDPAKPTFWVLEGLLYYLTKDSIIQLLQRMDALSAPKSEFWTDLCGREVFEDRSWGFTSLFSYGEEDFFHGVLASIHWDLKEQANLSNVSTHYGRVWKPIELEMKDKQKKPLPWVFMMGKKPETAQVDAKP